MGVAYSLIATSASGAPPQLPVKRRPDKTTPTAMAATTSSKTKNARAIVCTSMGNGPLLSVEPRRLTSEVVEHDVFALDTEI